MKLHLISGFLGSGKTTGIVMACKQLSKDGMSTAIITNDQGQVLVDSQFVQSLGIAQTEVTGGCFCCNYDDLVAGIDHLKTTNKPSIIFAESVGSCTDLVATVLKPMLKFREDAEHITFSTFVDARLLYTHMLGLPLPFNSDTNYIWEKQLEEAEILIVNKMDLTNHQVAQFLHEKVQKYFPLKQILFQNSRDISSVRKWLDVLDADLKHTEHMAIEIDYNRYGLGEANLAWLDEEVEITTIDNSALAVANEFVSDLAFRLETNKVPVGHLKFLVACNGQSHSISYTAIPDKGNIVFPDTKTNVVKLVVNVRAQTTPETLDQILNEVVKGLASRTSVSVSEKNLSLFKPGFPIPTHRMMNR